MQPPHTIFFKITYHCIFLAPIPALFNNCDSSKSKVKEDQAEKAGMIKEQNHVNVTTLASSTFSNEIISNGKLLSISKSDLHFKAMEVIAQIKLRYF